MHPVPRDPGDPCVGPNHGNPNALPFGMRNWVKGYCLSITQQILGQPDSAMVFCSSDCMCDWHGAHAAFVQDQIAANPDFEGIPGRFTLIWITPPSAMVRNFEDWDGLTAQVGEYQQRIVKMAEAREGGWTQPFREGDMG